jgi:hypothetical protein
MEPFSIPTKRPYRLFNASIRARLGRMLGVPLPGQETGYPGARPSYREVMEQVLRLASDVGVHRHSVHRWIRRDHLLGPAMPRRRGDKAQPGGAPTKRNPETIARVLDAYRQSTSIRTAARTAARKAGIPFGTILQWTQGSPRASLPF